MVVLELLPFLETKILTSLEIMASFSRFFKGTNSEPAMILALEPLVAFRNITEEGNKIRLLVKMIRICSYTRPLRSLRIRTQIISLLIKFLLKFLFRSRKRKLMCLRWLQHHLVDVVLFLPAPIISSSFKAFLLPSLWDQPATKTRPSSPLKLINWTTCLTWWTPLCWIYNKRTLLA